MLADMTYESFVEWQTYFRAEPFGEMRADLRIGNLCALVANLFRDEKKRPDPYTAADFVLFRERDEDDDSKRDILAPETRAWLYMMAAKTEAEKAKANAS
jgi:hypothetical protein